MNRIIKGFSLPKQVFIVLFLLLMIAILIAIATIIFYRIYFPGPIIADHQSWGAFGNFFGGLLGPTFAFFSFLALLVTISIQSREYHLSTKELAASALALKKQSQAITLQNFENILFHMIQLHNNIVEDIYFENPEPDSDRLSGKDCFQPLYEYEFSTTYKKCTDSSNGQDELSIIRESIENFFINYQSKIEHYFRNLFLILTFIENSNIENKKFYLNIIQAQLSTFEVVFLFYVGLCENGFIELKELIERNEFLQNLKTNKLINPARQLPLYKKSAYGNLNINFFYE